MRNGAPYLEEAVASILSQTHRELELLLVDDHSDDAAVTVLDAGDPRLKVLSSPGRGVVDAFNHGLNHAKGGFIARMDADDVALPRRIESQLALLEDQPCIDICGTGVHFFPERDVAGGNRHYQSWLNSLTSSGEIHRQIFIESPVPNPTAMFRRAAIESLGGYRDVDWPEDYDLFLRADRAGMKMAKTPEILLHWREHANRLTRTDDRYTRSRFQEAKAHYLAAGRLPDRPFLLWGAGPGGAEMFDLLEEQGRVAEAFLEVHPRRVGGRKRGRPVWHFEEIPSPGTYFIVIAVGARNARTEIRLFLSSSGYVEGPDYLFAA